MRQTLPPGDEIGSGGDVARGPNDSTYVFGSFTAIDGVLRRNLAKLKCGLLLRAGLRRVLTSTTRRKHLSIRCLFSEDCRLQNQLIKLAGDDGEYLVNLAVTIETTSTSRHPTQIISETWPYPFDI